MKCRMKTDKVEKDAIFVLRVLLHFLFCPNHFVTMAFYTDKEVAKIAL